MRKVLEWCEQHRKDPPASADDDSDSRKKSTDIDEWDQKFMHVDQEMLFEIILVSPPSCALWSNINLFAGCELPGYQGSAGRRLQDRGQHDQGQVAGRNPEDFQHSERFHS